MYGWALNCLKDLICNKYGDSLWEDVEARAGLKNYDWEDSTHYADEDFFRMVNVIVAILPELSADKIMPLYGSHFLKFLRNKSPVSRVDFGTRSLYDHMLGLAGVFATLGIMSMTSPIKVWCSKDSDYPDKRKFNLYCRVEGDEVSSGFCELIEGTVEAVAFHYVGTGVEFERCAIQDVDDSEFYKWIITEVPLSEEQQDADVERVLQQKHLFLKHGLSPQQLDILFPFHIVFDPSLHVVQTGEKCLKQISAAVVGSKITDIFDIDKSINLQQLPTWDEIQRKLRGEESSLGNVVTDFCLSTSSQKTHLGHAFSLIGQLSFSVAEEVAVFLCYPNASSLARMEDLGVVLKDLSKSDKIQMQKGALADTVHGMEILNANQNANAILVLKEALVSAQDKLVTKQSFVRYVSHEIRTPLMVVDIGLQLLNRELGHMLTMVTELLNKPEALSEQYSSSNTPVKKKPSNKLDSPNSKDDNHDKNEDISSSVHKSLETVKECQDSMSVAIDILNDLLAYEKLESGVFQLNKVPVLASGFLEETVKEFQLLAQEKSIKLKCVNMLPPKLDSVAYLYVDNRKIKQVVRNFLSNAVKFTPSHGMVTFKWQHSLMGESESAEQAMTREEMILLSDSQARNSINTNCASLTKPGDLRDEDTKRHHSIATVQKSFNVGGIDYIQHGNIIVCCVDDGVGILKENQSRIFKSIVQFKPDELQNGGGSGLGLYIARGIVNTHGGHTGVFSAGEGKGSSFFFSLPLYITSKPQALSQSLSGQSDEKKITPKNDEITLDKMKVFSGLRVLVVDDSSMVRKMLVKVLKGLGSVVTEATDGQAAIGVVKEKLDKEQSYQNNEEKGEKMTPTVMPFDLILMDSVMPNISGIEATEEIVENLGFTNLVVGLTGNILPNDIAEFKQHGACAVLPKPLVMEDLANILLSQDN